MTVSFPLLLTDDERSRVGERLGSAVMAAAALPCGSSTPTVRLRLVSGGSVVIQRLSGARARAVMRATHALDAAGLSVPIIVGVITADRGALVIFEDVGGLPGSIAIGSDDEEGMAASMGRMLALLRTADPMAVPADDSWLGPDALVAGAAVWARRLRPQHAAGLMASVTRIACRPWSVATSHGDFVPVNALAGPSGMRALIDLGDVRRRHALVDPAWWLLIVRHHHPVSFSRLRHSLLTAAYGAGASPAEEALADVAVARAAQLLAGGSRVGRAHRERLLESAQLWATTSREQVSRER